MTLGGAAFTSVEKTQGHSSCLSERAVATYWPKEIEQFLSGTHHAKTKLCPNKIQDFKNNNYHPQAIDVTSVENLLTFVSQTSLYAHVRKLELFVTKIHYYFLHTVNTKSDVITHELTFVSWYL
jgi:hypothetical protein